MLKLYVTPWPRAKMTDAEWDTLRGLDIDGHLMLSGDSKRGPFRVRLNAEGLPEIRGVGATVAEAIESAARQAAAA
jgi:hypothetical protein